MCKCCGLDVQVLWVVAKVPFDNGNILTISGALGKAYSRLHRLRTAEVTQHIYSTSDIGETEGLSECPFSCRAVFFELVS